MKEPREFVRGMIEGNDNLFTDCEDAPSYLSESEKAIFFRGKEIGKAVREHFMSAGT